MADERDVAEETGEATAPPLAVAPFDAAEAKTHQDAWAKHLGVPVEVTNSIGMKLVLIPPGEFMMGSSREEIDRLVQDMPPDERNYAKLFLEADQRQHRVRLTKPCYLGLYEVTQGEYERITGTNPSAFSRSGNRSERVSGQDTSRFPVERVSWEEAVGFSYGTTTKGTCLERTTTVGSYSANAFGLYDMHGNVLEWCSDWCDRGYYAISPVDDPTGPATGSFRVSRGGSCYCVAEECRSAHRGGYLPSFGARYLGFRVAFRSMDQSGR
jgi:formylglycine-generating enzyme required for sulfatase activity